ncbi:MAG: Sir2 family NAD-dependent protein deacetylase [Chloroflexota bacterium]
MASGVQERIDTLAKWMSESRHLVVFTGAGISTASGLPDFRGPDGIWTRQEKGLPAPSLSFSSAEPNASHMAIVELQRLGKLKFLISQNVDNLHLKSGIRPELLAELHGNVTKFICRNCGFKCDSFPDLETCPECSGRLTSSVVNFGDPLPVKDLQDSEWHSRNCDLFIAIGSSLVVHPAADMPRIALDSGSRLVIINKQETPFDRVAHLRFWEEIGEVFPEAVQQLKDLMNQASR